MPPMRNQEQGRALLADIETYCRDLHIGPDDAGCVTVVLKLMRGTTLTTAVYGQVLRWAGEEIAVNLRPGVWTVNLPALRAAVAEAAPAVWDPEAAREAFLRRTGL